MKRSNSSKRNIVVASAVKSAKFLRGIVRANSAKSLMSVLKSSEDAPIDMSSSDQREASTSSTSSTGSSPGLRKPQRMASIHQKRSTPATPVEAGPRLRKPERALSAVAQQLGRQPFETPLETPYTSFSSASSSRSSCGASRKENIRKVSFATHEDGSVQCAIKNIDRIENKSECWYSIEERNDFAESFSSVVEYYQDNAEYVESLKRLYNIARLTPQETEQRLHTLANHPHARGLENYIVRKGSVLRRKHMCRVLAQQDVMQWASSSDLHLTDDEDDCPALDADEETDDERHERLAEELRLISINSSQRCQRLAYQMATFDTNEAMIAVCSPWQTQRRKWHAVLQSSLGQSSRTLSNSSNDENFNARSPLVGCSDRASSAPRPARRLAPGLSFNSDRDDESSSNTASENALSPLAETPTKSNKTPPVLKRHGSVARVGDGQIAVDI